MYSVLVFSFYYCYAQYAQAVLEGIVTDKQGLPVPYGTVAIDNTALESSIDENGTFIISGINDGKHMLIISSTGYVTSRKELQLHTGDTVHMNSVLQTDATQIQQVEIISRKETGYKNTSREC